MTTRTELLPGVFLTSMQDNRFKTACLSLSFFRPLREGEAAMNALLPDILLRGSEKTPSLRAVAERLDTLHGASAGGLVRKMGEIQLTGLFADCLEDRYAGEPVFSQLLELIFELLLHPRTERGVFPPEITAQERDNLRSAMQSVLDDKSAYCERQMLRRMCRGEAYACSRLGEPDELDAIDGASVRAQYETVLAASRAELFYLGSKPVEEVSAMLLPHLRQLPRAAITPASTVPGPVPAAPRRFQQTMPLSQSRLCMGFRTGASLRDAQYPAMLLLNAMLGSGGQNRLYTVIRGQKALCYEAGSWYDGHKGILAACVGCARADLSAAEAEILHQVDELAAGRFSRQELAAARAGLLSDLFLLGDSPGRLDEFYLSRAAAGLSQSPEALCAALRAVTAEEVCAQARLLRPDTIYTLEGSV